MMHFKMCGPMNPVFLITILCIFGLAHCGQSDDEEAKATLEKYIEEQKEKVNPRYRLKYHVAAPVGWINDPNGFSYYEGKYHLFYQYYPYDSVWGPMHWGHVTSRDLVRWSYAPTALLPGDEQCFSGSAAVEGNKITLMYTAHRNLYEPPYYNESQYLAFSDDGVNFKKYEGNPVIPAAPADANGYVASDFRDPKVWRHGEHWYVVLGSKTSDNRGRVLLYRSEDLRRWEFLSVLAEASGNMGYMWECPDFFELDGKFVLLMSPQGMTPEGDRYLNTHQTGYIVGRFDYTTHKFQPTAAFQELDFGHDFYAAQTQEVSGRRLLVAWFGMWEVAHPEAEDKWAGAMTVVRELRLNSVGHLGMWPVEELTTLRKGYKHGNITHKQKLEGFGSTLELLVSVESGRPVSLLLEGVSGGGWVRLLWDPTRRLVVVDRGSGDVRQVEWGVTGVVRWRVLLDTSSVELFCGEGEVVFSSRVYPLGGWKITNEGDAVWINSYTLNI